MKPRRRTATGLSRASSLKLRGKVWVEVGGLSAMTEAGADLLEQIAVCGSVSEAARRLRFSYRRAWITIDQMNRRLPNPVVNKSIGGNRGGGTELTEFGMLVLRSYRNLQHLLEHLLDEQIGDFEKLARRARIERF